MIMVLARPLPWRFTNFCVRRWGSSLTEVLQLVDSGKLSISEAESKILRLPPPPPNEALSSFANLDHSRSRRTGFPEAIFAEGKTAKQVATILDDMARNVNERLQSDHGTASVGNAILATRVTTDQFKEIAEIPLDNGVIQYHETARIISMEASSLRKCSSRSSLNGKRNKIVVACAGTTDLPVAEEAAITVEAAGCEAIRVYDAGVAGLHRIIQSLPKLRDPQVGCIIVCAGMDGALPSVVGGLVNVPVIAVPTSIGYGASFGGVSAMLTMLNSCAPGVGVVNIDNGFGAAALAYKCIAP
mmetsp:Transcript_12200/g.18720  ORF Transcript_12200/g.18720 Transcript_12200/m.18720 type:complete len:301 (+) Transcript_12200:136-1038(+)|eukprot:CAMPEP_0178913604 /NCGR_PEP_ID=MMETSP0786-20121207/10939_1 /TAXON_ID=186022 /ORGANISM="Thalassionema frauenfeldii, Strain CCMP 1798" /LENGTH=300 /DNA_ID=CAMNT_0020586373 /DNA_START=24 /DNA_END=926 /DNA_ORIENTATION=+